MTSSPWLTYTLDQARDMMLGYHQSGDFWAKNKGIKDVVTEADMALEKLIATAVAKNTPNIPLLSEENPQSHTLNLKESLWILDPLDGTINFSHGFPFFALSLARIEKGQIQEAWIDVPALAQRFYAGFQKGAFCNDQPIRVSAVEDITQALLVVSRREKVQAALALENKLKNIISDVQSYRRTGSAVFNYTRIAMGQMDLFLAKDLGIWDMAAGHLLVREAGGQVVTWSGQPHEDLQVGDILAGPRPLLDQIYKKTTREA